MRGLRLREGNIQIGGEKVLDPLFREERFNRWCVGEVHIVDKRLLPNGRRDYFEPSPHMRQVENQLESIIQKVVSRCRTASSTRNQTRKVQTTIDHMEDAFELAGSGYLKAIDARILIDKALQNAKVLEESLDPEEPDHAKQITELERLKAKLTKYRAKQGRPSIEGIPKSETATYRRVFRALTELCPSPRAAREMIEGILSYK